MPVFAAMNEKVGLVMPHHVRLMVDTKTIGPGRHTVVARACWSDGTEVTQPGRSSWPARIAESGSTIPRQIQTQAGLTNSASDPRSHCTRVITLWPRPTRDSSSCSSVACGPRADRWPTTNGNLVHRGPCYLFMRITQPSRGTVVNGVSELFAPLHPSCQRCYFRLVGLRCKFERVFAGFLQPARALLTFARRCMDRYGTFPYCSVRNNVVTDHKLSTGGIVACFDEFVCARVPSGYSGPFADSRLAGRKQGCLGRRQPSPTSLRKSLAMECALGFPFSRHELQRETTSAGSGLSARDHHRHGLV